MIKKQKNYLYNSETFKNWTLNKNYLFNIKNLGKYLLKQINFYLNYKFSFKEKFLLKNLIKKNTFMLISLLDKSIKKNILNNKTVDKKKIKIMKIFNTLKSILIV